MRLSRTEKGQLQLNGVCDRNRQSLQDLGLEGLLEIDPVDTEWSSHVENVRETLEPLSDEDPDHPDAAHLLEAHRKLCEVSDENTERFSAVLDALEKRVVGK